LILEDFILKKWPTIKPRLQVTISKLIGMLHFSNICMIFMGYFLFNEM